MPKTPAHILKAKAEYNRKPEVQARRVKNNAARREALREGLVHKGDGKDVAHKVALDNGGGNSKSNLTVQERGVNRAWRKGRKGYSVPNT